MNKLFITCAISFSLASNIFSNSFTDVNDKTQVYVINKLVSMLKAEQILVVYTRVDEWACYSAGFTFSQASALGLKALRYCEQLKGRDTFTEDRFFAYLPYSVTPSLHSRKDEVCYYYPVFPLADQHILIFCKKYPHLQQDKLSNINLNFIKDYISDARTLTEEEFLKKYQLHSLFTNSVYATYMPGIFEVDHPVSVQGCATHCSEDLTKRKIKDKSGLIKLSRREVSEIVYIAYLLEGKDGALKYAETVKKSKILEPIQETTFMTQIGQKLYAKVKSNMKTGGNEKNDVGKKK